MGGRFALAFAALARDVWGGECCELEPAAVKAMIARKDSAFLGMDQQVGFACGEGLRWVLIYLPITRTRMRRSCACWTGCTRT